MNLKKKFQGALFLVASLACLQTTVYAQSCTSCDDDEEEVIILRSIDDNVDVIYGGALRENESEDIQGAQILIVDDKPYPLFNLDDEFVDASFDYGQSALAEDVTVKLKRNEPINIKFQGPIDAPFALYQDVGIRFSPCTRTIEIETGEVLEVSPEDPYQIRYVIEETVEVTGAQGAQNDYYHLLVYTLRYINSAEDPHVKLTINESVEYSRSDNSSIDFNWLQNDYSFTIVTEDPNNNAPGSNGGGGGSGSSSSSPSFSSGSPSSTPSGSSNITLPTPSTSYNLGLGMFDENTSAGKLSFGFAYDTATNYSPEGLVANTSPAVSVIRDSNTSYINQVLSAETLVNVVTIDVDTYQLNFYKTSGSETLGNDGTYTPDGSLITTWEIDNPGDSAAGNSRVSVTKTDADGTTDTSIIEQLSNGTIVTTQNGNLVETIQWSDLSAGGINKAQKEIIIEDHSGATPVTVSHTREISQEFPWGWEQIEEIEDPNGQNLIDTWSYYDDVADTDPAYSQTKLSTYSDGTWRYNAVFDADGNVTEQYLPWEDITAAQAIAASGNNCTKTVTTEAADGTTTDITYIEGIQTSQYVSSSDSTTSTRSTYSAAGVSQTTTTLKSGSRTQSITYPDGRMTSYLYEDGFWDGTTFTTTDPGNAEEAFRKTTKNGTVTSPEGIANLSTWSRYVTVDSETVLSETLAYDGTTANVIETTTYSETADFPVAGKTTNVTYRNGVATYTEVYNELNQLESSTGQDGVTTTYTYNDRGLTETQTRAGIITLYSYDVLARVDSTTVYSATSGGEILTSSETYDSAGNISTRIDQNGYTTSYSYGTDSAGRRTETTTSPDGSTTITTYHLDGQLLSVTGTGTVAQHYTYTVNSDGTLTTRTSIGSDTSPRYTQTTTDWAGRTILTERPTFDGTGTWSRASFYDPTTGKLTKTTQTGLYDSLYTYNDLGTLTRQGLDADADGALTENSTDTLSETLTSYVLENGNYYRQSVSKQWTRDNDASLASIATTTSKTQLTGLPVGTLSAQIYTDVYGNDTTSTTTVSGNVITRTTDTPSSDTDIISITTNGRVTSQNTATVSEPTTYEYDALGRLWKTYDPLDNLTTMSYYENTTQVETVDAPAGPDTTYTYHAQGALGAGQVSDQELIDATTATTLSQITYGYDARGNLTSETGTATYPKEYGYHSVYPEMVTLKTYRDATGTADTTTWDYHEATGLLEQKVFADLTNIDYTYHDSGNLHTRTSERGMLTTYTYDGYGSLDLTYYSDGTPSIDTDYNRARRLTQVTDAAGTHTMSYTVAGQLDADVISGTGDLSGYTLDNTFTDDQRSSFQLLSGTSTVMANDYTYTPNGRLYTVTSSGNTATYTYKTNTDRVETITHNNGISDVFTQTKTYADALLRLTSIVNASSSGTITSHAPAYDAFGRIDTVTREDSTVWDYGYNDRGEVTSGSKQRADGSTIPGYQFGYSFDDIGNRESISLEGTTYDYGDATSTNQLTSWNAPSTRVINGTADAAAAITVNGVVADRTGTDWSTSLSLDNSTAPVWKNIEVVGKLANAGANGETVVATSSGNILAPQTPEAFSYDADGNLTSDGLWSYTWNAENRLTTMESLTTIPEAARKKLTFSYDYVGRRYAKEVANWDSATQTYQPQSKTLFLYDGWNLIAELDALASNTLTRSYTWGTDLSGSEQGAGGVGGLLMMTDGTDSYFPGYDYNGNVSCLVKDDTTTAATYDYSPFGKLITATGEYAKTNPYKFSTKYEDAETGLLYYGYRYYGSVIGRWLNRDPVDEDGGYNLYGFIENNAIGQTDYLGFYTLQDAVNSLRSRGVTPARNGRNSKLYSGHQQFDEWYRLEMSRGSWWTSLPKCPKKICVYKTTRRRNGGGHDCARNIHAKEIKKWGLPKKPGQAELLLHPGTKWSMRSKVFSNKSNQCTYDEEGLLLREPTGSGTVDYKAPPSWSNWNLSAHYYHDVKPVLLAARLDGQNKTLTSGVLMNTPRVSKYLQVRPLWAEDE